MGLNIFGLKSEKYYIEIQLKLKSQRIVKVSVNRKTNS